MTKMDKKDFSEMEYHYSPGYTKRAITSWQLIWLYKRPNRGGLNFDANYKEFLLLIFDLIGVKVEVVGNPTTEILESKLIESFLKLNTLPNVKTIKDFVKPTRQLISTTLKEHANHFPDAKNWYEHLVLALTYSQRILLYVIARTNFNKLIQQNLEFLVFFILRRKKYIQLSLIRGEKWD